MMTIGWIIATLATVLLLIAALGVLRLPDALSRQHAATKAATLSVTLFALALGVTAFVSGWGWGWIARLVLILVFLLMAVPIASHALAFAAVREKK